MFGQPHPTCGLPKRSWSIISQGHVEAVNVELVKLEFGRSYLNIQRRGDYLGCERWTACLTASRWRFQMWPRQQLFNSHLESTIRISEARGERIATIDHVTSMLCCSLMLSWWCSASSVLIRWWVFRNERVSEAEGNVEAFRRVSRSKWCRKHKCIRRIKHLNFI